MKNINIDMNQVFENCDIDNAHAIDTIGNFLQSIANGEEQNINNVKIEKLTFKNDSTDNHILNLELELRICQAIKQICNTINQAADKRIAINQKSIEVLNTFINR